MHRESLVEGRADEIAMACCSGGDEAVRASAGTEITASAFEEGCLLRGRRIRVNFRSEIFAAWRDVPFEAKFPWLVGDHRASALSPCSSSDMLKVPR